MKKNMFKSAVSCMLAFSLLIAYAPIVKGADVAVSPSGAYTFRSETEGYASSEEKDFVVTNTGAVPLTNVDYSIDGDTLGVGLPPNGSAFEVVPPNPFPADIAAGDSETITIRPKTGIATNASSYTDTLRIYSDSVQIASVHLSFKVDAAPAPLTPITAAPITGVTSPAAGAAPSTAINGGTGFTSSLVWDNAPATFAAGTAYTATVTLTAAANYTFSGGFASTAQISGFTINSTAPTTWVSNNGTTLVFKVKFPVISGPLDAQQITITPPLTGDSLRYTITSPTGQGFSSSISWYNDTDRRNQSSGAFAASTIYTAEVRLTSNSGFYWPSPAPTITVTEGTITSNPQISNGTGTGNRLTFSVTFTQTAGSFDLPYITTESATRISNREIDVEISTRTSFTQVDERGVVYSRTNSNPTLYDDVWRSYTSLNNSTTTVRLTGLTSGSGYYVRAYASNSRGVAYGETIWVGGSSASGDVSTNSPTNVTSTSAVLGGYVYSSINSSVLERGVVYSYSYPTPTVSNGTTLKSSVTSSGSFSVTASGLQRDTRYYVRAYIRTSSGYSYGEALSFTTGVTGTGTVLTRGEFIEGSSGWRFEPSRNITRIEIAQMIYNLRGKPYVGEGISFFDAPSSQTELDALRYVTSMGYMIGYPDGSFRPYDPITRAEVVATACAVYGYSSTGSLSSFSDIQGHWAQGYIATANRYGFIHGYPDGTFLPNANMTRAEATVMFSRSENRTIAPLGSAQFIDVSVTHWAYSYIMSASIPRP